VFKPERFGYVAKTLTCERSWWVGFNGLEQGCRALVGQRTRCLTVKGLDHTNTFVGMVVVNALVADTSTIVEVSCGFISDT
jgi:hypothetical protein